MESFASYNPATGEEIGVYPVTARREVACAVERTRDAAERWRQTPLTARLAALRQLRQRLAADVEGLAETVTCEIGKPLQESFGADVLPTLAALDWLVKQTPRLLQPRRIGRKAWLTPEPYGVVGVIGTWNYPLFLNSAPIAWALAAGNAVVWKPSELASGCAAKLNEHLEAVGLPVTTLFGAGETGRALCRAGCDKIVFTGGVATGRAILAELSASGTPGVMELSGNDAFIVCADAPLELAAQSAVWGRCGNAGQSCVAPQRFYVAREVYDRFLLECQQVIERLRPGSDFGPMRTEALRKRTQQLVWEAVACGARLLVGGRPLDDLPGFHYAPTLLADCRPEMRVLRQDFFGPVLAVCPVRDVEEAILLTNADDMALGASVWTRSRKRGVQIAEQLRVGLVMINDVLLAAANPALPFGGLRCSGFGKQRGAAGLEEFVTWKAITVSRIGGARRHLFPYRPATLPILRGVLEVQAAQGFKAKLQAAKRLMDAARRWDKSE